MWPPRPPDHALIYQWSFWAANEIEPRIVSIARKLSRKPPDQAAITAGLEQLAGALAVLEKQLGGRPYLLGESFTVADLNLAATLREPGEPGVAGLSVIDLAPYPKVARWLELCSDRPAHHRVAALP